VGLQEVRWYKRDTVRTVDYIFFFNRKEIIHQLGTGFLVHHRIVSAVKGVEFVSDRMSCIVLRGHWCNVIDLNVNASSEEKSDDPKDSLYEELEQVFYHFREYRIKNSFRAF